MINFFELINQLSILFFIKVVGEHNKVIKKSTPFLATVKYGGC